MKDRMEEALAEIMRRREIIVLHRNRRVCRVLSGTAGALFAMLVLVISFLPERTGMVIDGSLYGSFLLRPAAGGYVLTAVISFSLGAAFTMLCLRYGKLNKPGFHRESDGKEGKENEA